MLRSLLIAHLVLRRDYPLLRVILRFLTPRAKSYRQFPDTFSEWRLRGTFQDRSARVFKERPGVPEKHDGVPAQRLIGLHQRTRTRTDARAREAPGIPPTSAGVGIFVRCIPSLYMQSLSVSQGCPVGR